MKKIWIIALLAFVGCTERTTLREPISYRSNYQIRVPNLQVCDGQVYSYYEKVGCEKYIGDRFQEIVSDLSLCEGSLQVPIQSALNLAPAGIISSEVMVNGSRNIYCHSGSTTQRIAIACLPGFVNFGTEYCLSPKMDIRGFNSYPVSISSMAVDSSGKIYVGGKFELYQLFSNNLGQTTYYGNSLLKLKQDWSDDWATILGDVNSQGWINDLIADDTGNIYITGIFNQINQQPVQKIAKMRSDGSLDLSFNMTVAFTTILKIKKDPKTEKIYVLGYPSNSSSLKLLRINSNGSLDGSFLEGIVIGEVESLQIDLDSRLYLIGRIEYYKETPIFGSVRILPNGTLDESINLYRTNIIYLDRKNNKLYMSRDELKLARLNLTDNSYSPEFYIGPLELSGDIKKITVDSESEMVYLVGANLYNNYVPMSNSVRLKKNGSFDYLFNDPFSEDVFSSDITELQYQKGWLLYRTSNSFGMRYIGL